MTLVIPAPQPQRWRLRDQRDVREAAEALAAGERIAHGFANFYAITTRPDRGIVQAANAATGRPITQRCPLT